MVVCTRVYSLQDLRHWLFSWLGLVRVGTSLLVSLCDVFFFSKTAFEKLTSQEEQSLGPVGASFLRGVII